MVPPMALFLSQHPMVSDYDLSCVQTIGVGAAPISQTTIDRMAARFRTFGNSKLEIRQSKDDRIQRSILNTDAVNFLIIGNCAN